VLLGAAELEGEASRPARGVSGRHGGGSRSLLDEGSLPSGDGRATDL